MNLNRTLLAAACACLALFLVAGTTVKRGPGHTGDIETHTTDGAGGTVPVSDGAAGLDMTDIATQTELDAATLFSDGFGGTAVQCYSSADVAVDWTGETTLPAGNNWICTIDATGDWDARSQGGSNSGVLTWSLDNLLCWEPAQTHRIWFNPHCTDDENNPARREGFLCAVNGDCDGVPSKCMHDGTTYALMVDQVPDPDTFNWTTEAGEWPYGGDKAAHDFGENGTVYSLPMAFQRGWAGIPVHEGAAGAYPDCVTASSTPVTMADASNYWVKVISQTQVEIYQDDGDLVEEVSTDDGALALDCNDRSNWQSLILRPRNADGSDPSQNFVVSSSQAIQVNDSDSIDEWVCSDDGTTECTTPWGTDPGGVCTAADAVCVPGNIPVEVDFRLAKGNMEGIRTNDTTVLEQPTGAFYDGETVLAAATQIMFLTPGQCIQAWNGIATSVDNGLDETQDPGSSISVIDAQRSLPVRSGCAYPASSAVGTSCMGFSLISNRGAGGATEIDLAAFTVGMDFCVVNEAGESFTVDPNGTERFAAPATDTAGDHLISTVRGDVFCAQTTVAGSAVVMLNSGGWNEE